MGDISNMYKETIGRKKVSSIFIILMLLTVSIVICDTIKTLQFTCLYTFKEYSTVGVILLVGFLILKQIDKCNTKYKYYIIADELIIYKLKGAREEVMENINIKDIVKVKKVNRIIGKLNTLISKKYGFLNFSNCIYVCEYSKDKKSNKFYFDPSNKFINKIDFLRKREY